MTGKRNYPGAPRWVKVSGVIAAALLLLAVVAILLGVDGEHGPVRHLPGSADDATPLEDRSGAGPG